MNESNKYEAILKAIRLFVATKLGRSNISWNEVEKIYKSGKYPDINETIDYIVGD